jgi:hypothetical protein
LQLISLMISRTNIIFYAVKTGKNYSSWDWRCLLCCDWSSTFLLLWLILLKASPSGVNAILQQSIKEAGKEG